MSDTKKVQMLEGSEGMCNPLEAPLFEFSDSDVEDAPEGILVQHDQLGIGYVLRPDRWVIHKMDGSVDNTKHTTVAFFGYAPAVVCENTCLHVVKPNMIRWLTLLEEAGMRKPPEEDFSPPAGLLRGTGKEREI